MSEDKNNKDIDNSPEAAVAEDSNIVEVGDLLKRIELLQKEADDSKQKALRSLADLDNFRRRATREREELRRTASSEVIEGLLPILDNLKLGLDSAAQHTEAKDITEGFKMVYSSLQNLLNEHGVVLLEPTGEVFDPNFHECVAHMPHAEIAEGNVSQVVRIGYKLNERLLRAATVVVSSGSEKNEEA